MAVFRKDGSTVGSIASQTGKIAVMAKDNWGVKLYDQSGNDIVHPINTSGNTYDGNVNLGYSSSRFKDLYLSGGVYLGGTGSANKLDDYEEGAWSPNIADDTGVRSTHTNQGKYVKIGSLVFVSARIFGGSSFTSTGTPYITLPFAAGGNQNQSVSSLIYSSGAGGATGVFLLDGNGYLNLTSNTDSALSSSLGNGTSMSSSSKRLYFGPIVYSIA